MTYEDDAPGGDNTTLPNGDDDDAPSASGANKIPPDDVDPRTYGDDVPGGDDHKV